MTPLPRLFRMIRPLAEPGPRRVSLCAQLVFGFAALIVPGAGRVPEAAAQNVTAEQVRTSILKAQRWLLGQQQGGEWQDVWMEGGTTALATLALLNSGIPVDDPAMRAAIEAVQRIPLRHTYVVALKIQALAAASPTEYQPEIRAAADWLIDGMQKDGMWTYSNAPGATDFSNSQFAMLGLYEAARAGVNVPDGVWRKAEAALLSAQHRDGHWSYRPGTNTSPLSMTCACLASLYITGNAVTSRREAGFTADGQAPRCGKYSEYRPIVQAFSWLSKNLGMRPGEQSQFQYYYLYAVERVGMIAGVQRIGSVDWYRRGAAALVASQAADGHWQQFHPIVDTSFALLFLAKGRRPILINKLAWSDDFRWNLDRNDLAHLIGFIGNRIGGPFSWEAVYIGFRLEDWQRAPILYFQGHEFPVFRPEHVSKLQQYVEQGGTLLVEACCGRPAFREGFEQFAKEAFPETPVYRLPPEHPVFRSLYRIDGAAVELHGIDLGCRTSIIYSPNDLSCLWEQANIPGKSRAAFELGANIAAYAIGLEPLPDKLAITRVAKNTASRPGGEPVERGTVQIAQLMHNGDWRPDPGVVPNLATHLHERLGTDVTRETVPLKATDERLARHPIVYMTGHYSFKLTPEEITALRRHLERGGFLMADACCGRKAFDNAFREMVRQMFPEAGGPQLLPVPSDHPIIRGQPGIPLPAVTYRPALQAEQPQLRHVVLEGVTLEERLAIVYSPYAIGCGLDGHACFSCRGLSPGDATNLAGNIILHALSY